MANDDMDRVIPLGKLDDYKVAEGDPDVRGWEVMASDGRAIGKVQELLVDRTAMKVRYLDVDVNDDVTADAAGDRHVLIPIGYARLERDEDRVMVDAISSADLRGMPTWDRGGPLTRDHENTVRDSFSARSMGADTRLSGEVGGSGLAGAGLSDTASTGGMTAGGAGMLDTAGLDNTPGAGTALGMGATGGLSSVRPDPGATAMGSTGMSASHGTVSGGLDLPSGRDATLASGTGTGLGGGAAGQSSSSAGMSVGGTSMGGEALNATGTGSAGNMGTQRGGVTDGGAGNSADTLRGAPGLGTGGSMGSTGGMSAGGSTGSTGGMSSGGSMGSTGGMSAGGSMGSTGGMSAGGSTGGLGGDVSHQGEGSAGSDYMHNSDEDFYATDAFNDNRFYGSRRSGSGATGGADADETIRAAREASQRLREDLDNRGVGGTGNM